MSSRSLSPFVLALGIAIATASTATSQCAAVPGTGCGGAIPLVCVGPPQINQMAQVTYAAGPADLVLSSINFDGTLLGLPLGLACGPGCVLAGLPAAWAFGVGACQFLFFVPNNPGLVGMQFYGQAFYAPAALGYSCWLGSNAIVGTVIP